MKYPSLTLLPLAILTVGTHALPKIFIKGSKFFTEHGDQWFVKGIAYQLVPTDPLIDTAQCQRDANLMKTLGANSIRVYHVDPRGNHDGCMKTFDDAGIYAFIDLDDFDTAINEDNPEWDSSKYSAYARVMDAFHQYNNVAGFFVGNEVLTKPAGAKTAPYVKAAASDMIAYRDSKRYRKIPIGYSAADIASLRPMLQDYLVCPPASAAERGIEFFALNAYEWCGQSTYEQSGYQDLNKMAQNFSVPIFFSETGCNTARPRTFADQAAILGPQMNQIWSGAIVYEWIEEANSYGLISYGPKVDPASPNAPPDGFPRSGEPKPYMPEEFENLKRQWMAVQPTRLRAEAYQPAQVPPVPCPPVIAGQWEVNPTGALPVLHRVDGAGADTLAPTPSLASGTRGPNPSPERSSLSAPPSASSSVSGARGVGSWSATPTWKTGVPEAADMTKAAGGTVPGFPGPESEAVQQEKERAEAQSEELPAKSSPKKSAGGRVVVGMMELAMMVSGGYGLLLAVSR